MVTWNEIFEISDMLYPNEKGVQNTLPYVGIDDAVGFIYSEFARDTNELAALVGDELAHKAEEHYYNHCV